MSCFVDTGKIVTLAEWKTGSEVILKDMSRIDQYQNTAKPDPCADFLGSIACSIQTALLLLKPGYCGQPRDIPYGANPIIIFSTYHHNVVVVMGHFTADHPLSDSISCHITWPFQCHSNIQHLPSNYKGKSIQFGGDILPFLRGCLIS